MKIIGKKIIQLKDIDSTNDEAKRLIKTGAGEGLVIVAGSQSKGRGKPGSDWFSAPNEGVYLSAIVQPFKSPKDVVPITQLGARAVVALIKKVTGLKAQIKPPNDVLVNGKKICGILVERAASGQVIIGIGVNINNELDSFPENISSTATSLKIESSRQYEIKTIIEDLLAELDREYLAYLEGI